MGPRRWRRARCGSMRVTRRTGTHAAARAAAVSLRDVLVLYLLVGVACSVAVIRRAPRAVPRSHASSPTARRLRFERACNPNRARAPDRRPGVGLAACDQRDKLGALGLGIVLPHPARVGTFGADHHVRAVQRLQRLRRGGQARAQAPGWREPVAEFTYCLLGNGRCPVIRRSRIACAILERPGYSLHPR
jgi:hypothetical protein